MKATRERRLNSDQLGAKGEQRFQEICFDAGLEVNSSGRDRTGWDFFVEFPFEQDASGLTIPSRRQPIESRVQLKTVWDGRKRVKLRLSAAERLVKSECPTFIYVFAVSDRLEFLRMHAIHIDGEILCRVMGRLREMLRDGKATSINKEFIEINFQPYRSIPVQGDSLRSSMEEAVGADYSSYVQKKVAVLKEGGFGAIPFRGSFSVKAANQKELSDFMLGLTPLPAVSFEAFETRWGVDLPVEAPTGIHEIRLDPYCIKADVSFRQSGQRAININMDMTLPAIRGPEIDFLLSSANLQIHFRGLGATWHQRGIKNIKTKFSTYKKLLSLSRMLMNADVNIQVTHKNHILVGTMLHAGSKIKNFEHIGDFEEIGRIIGIILEEAGEEDIILPSEIEEKFTQDLSILHSLIAYPENIAADGIVLIDNTSEIRCFEESMLFFKTIEFGENLVAAYSIGVASLTATESSKEFAIHVRNFSLRCIRIIDKTPDAIKNFVQLAKVVTGVTSHFSI